MAIPIESLLTDISPDAPSGADLEYDPEFARMEKAAQETPDQDFGSTHIEGVPADWETVSSAASGILERTHDLRVATYLAQAELKLSGILGLRDGLQLITGYLEKYWDTVFPRLDEDDDNDPTSRINALAALNKAGGVLRQLRLSPIVRSRSVGVVTWTDASIARGDLPVPEGMEDPPTAKKIEAVVRSSSFDDLNALCEAVDQSVDYVERIERSFSDRLGYGSVPDLEQLGKDLKSIAKFQKPWLDSIRPAASKTAEAKAPVEDRGLIQVETSESSQAQPVHIPQALYGAESFNIRQREDAIEGLDKIISWFERFEPSSPLPMLLRRAKRLSTMSFMEILQDISPGGIEQALLVGGAEPESSTARSANSADNGMEPQSRPRDDDY